MLRGKVASLEEELSKSRQEATNYHQLSDRLAKVRRYLLFKHVFLVSWHVGFALFLQELKDLKDHDQQMRSKVGSMLSYGSPYLF